MARCEVCGEGEAQWTCGLCGRVSCSLDYSVRENLCSICLETICQVCGKRLALTHCLICGKLVCRVDSVRRGLGRVCLGHKELNQVPKALGNGP